MTIPAAAFEPILTAMALLFLPSAQNDRAKASEAARQHILAHNPRTMAELTLAAGIVGFSLQSLQLLGDAAEPGMALRDRLRVLNTGTRLDRQA